MDRVREMVEKPEAVVNAVVNNHIHDDLAFFILSKLPLKSLKRFGCVYKSWSLLFDNPCFMSMFRNNFTNTSLLLKQDFLGEKYQSLLCLMSGERFENRVRLDFPPSILRNAFYFDVIGSSVNGILCLYYGSYGVLLWNPTIREFKVVPSGHVDFKPPFEKPLLHYVGFGHDRVRDDYKVIRYFEFFVPYKEELGPLWEIYSLRSNSWKKLDCKMPTNFFLGDNSSAQAYTDGVCHWWGTNGNWHVSCLVSFDLINEVFFTTPMPSYMGDCIFDSRSRRVQLAVINESVAFISNYVEKTTIEISILGEIGVKESWTKLFIVESLPCIVDIIGMGRKGDVFFRKEDGELAWFDWSTHMIVDLGIKGRKFGCQIVTYKENFESLISIGFEKQGNI